MACMRPPVRFRSAPPPAYAKATAGCASYYGCKFIQRKHRSADEKTTKEIDELFVQEFSAKARELGLSEEVIQASLGKNK